MKRPLQEILLRLAAIGSLLAPAPAFPLSTPDWVPDHLLEPPAQEPWLCQGRYLLPEQGQAVLQAFLETHPDRGSWEAFATESREHILAAIGLDPMPEKTPLTPVISSRREYDGYSVENVRFQSLPGYWVTGNLYRPLDTSGPHPAVLHTHGHSSAITGPESWIRNGRFKPDVQERAAGLARMGAVCLTIDMVGYGDSARVLVGDVHHSDQALPTQVWNAIRAVDFLTGLDDVDPGRIGVTGHSGGGTQAFLLSALDPRISVSVPVAMVSSWFFGGCDCESGLPIHAGDRFFQNNAMIAALTAPRPLLTVSDGGDWTVHTPEIEFPFLETIWGYYGAADKVANVHIPDEGHDYGLSKRLAMYPFMAEYLGLNLSRIQNAQGDIDESMLVVEDPQLMRNFSGPDSVPDLAIRTYGQLRDAWRHLRSRAAFQASGSASSLFPYELRCDGMVDPLGVDSSTPGFSWKLEGISNGALQTAYQVQVARDAVALEAGADLLWDSGWVETNEQLNIPYAGQPLQSGMSCAWRLRVRDGEGKATPWSMPARFYTGILDASDWRASWIAHPDWLKFNRPHLGYRSHSEDSVDVEKWIQIDLGRSVPVDEVKLSALRHTVAERLGFPQYFKVELSDDPEFSDPVVLVDYTETPFENKWIGSHTIPADGAIGRYVRVTANRLRDMDGEICLAFSQIQVVSGGENVAVGSAVTASDSIEEGLWSAAAVVDGKGIPGTNPMDNKTAIMRRDFRVGELPARAVLHVSGEGQYVLYLNGERVGEEKLSPGWTDARKTVLYDSYDVLPLLKQGGNALGIALAGGMYSVPSPQDRYTKFIGRFRPLMAILQLKLEYADGHVEYVTTDDKWMAREGPTTYSHVYGGEDFNAGLVSENWSKAGFDTAGWVRVSEVDGPGGMLRGASHSHPAIRTMAILDPAATNALGDGSVVYDLGQNTSLMPRIRVQGPAGSRVRIVPSELVHEDGSLRTGSSGRGKRWWEYTLAGGDRPETWEAEFFYQGARYLQVIPMPAEEGGELPELLSLEGLVTHSSAPPVGHFESSSGLFNRIRTLIRWAQRSNMVSVLTDCPHRERLGWLEQYHLNGPSIRYEFDLDRLFRKTFQDMADAQTEAGLVPDIAPEYIVFDGAFRDSPEWGSAIIIAAWQQYLFSGDEGVLETYYDNMKEYFRFLRGKSESLLLDHGLGDWYDLGPKHPGVSQLTPIGLTASATFYQDAVRLASISAVLGRDLEQEAYLNIATAIRSSFNRKYFDQAALSYGTGSQTSNAMPYYLGMVPEGDEAGVLEAIVEDIREHGNSLTSGDVGHRYLLRALAEGLRPDVVYDMHHQDDRPGYGYQLKMGATSLTEAWDANPGPSQNHFMLGHLMEWFYHDLAGLAPAAGEPGFGMVEVRPQPAGDITWARATYDSVRGPVTVSWERDPDSFSLRVGIPANAGAVVHLPAGKDDAILMDGHDIGQNAEARFINQDNHYRSYVISSGTYTFQVLER